MELDNWNIREMNNLALIYQGFSHPARIAVLVAIDSGLNLKEASDFLDIKRPSLQDHVDKLVEAELVYRPSDGATYQLTPMGEYFMDSLLKEREYILKVLELLDEEEEELRAAKEPEMKELDEYDVPIDENELERQIHTRKWEDLGGKIQGMIDDSV